MKWKREEIIEENVGELTRIYCRNKKLTKAEQKSITEVLEKSWHKHKGVWYLY